ncbi:hypothetical protein WG78_08915 [Amantichitinum ursilacus]|uniref:Uncharacterized protein n=1 Tax=Amantichitinum ursilacus TaxID=857265 RepID=A0A0N0XLC2_9NEIS|nr:hypothetical protein WG78_08915 [Amantichitinum ursilacus]
MRTRLIWLVGLTGKPSPTVCERVWFSRRTDSSRRAVCMGELSPTHGHQFVGPKADYDAAGLRRRDAHRVGHDPPNKAIATGAALGISLWLVGPDPPYANAFGLATRKGEEVSHSGVEFLDILPHVARRARRRLMHRVGHDPPSKAITTGAVLGIPLWLVGLDPPYANAFDLAVGADGDAACHRMRTRLV